MQVKQDGRRMATVHQCRDIAENVQTTHLASTKLVMYMYRGSTVHLRLLHGSLQPITHANQTRKKMHGPAHYKHPRVNNSWHIESKHWVSCSQLESLTYTTSKIPVSAISMMHCQQRTSHPPSAENQGRAALALAALLPSCRMPSFPCKTQCPPQNHPPVTL